jgi:DNA polymerase III alpha subunit (gram-positive type)
MIDKKQSLLSFTSVAFDIETIHLMPVVKRIVEIGAVKFRLGKVVENVSVMTLSDKGP